MYFKNENQTQQSSNRNRNNKRDRDNDNQQSPQTTQNDSKKAKKDKGNKDVSVVSNKKTITEAVAAIVVVAPFRDMARCVTTGVAAT